MGWGPLPASPITQLTSEITVIEETRSEACWQSLPEVYLRTGISTGGNMDIDGSYFFYGELDDLVLAHATDPMASPHPREWIPDEGEPLEGETLPEDALQAIRTWLGF
jgi:hypothetical protein